MKQRILSSGIVVLFLAAGSASAGIGIFSDPAGSDCNLTLPNSVPTLVYVLYMGEGGPQATGAEYSIAGMPGTFGVTFTADLINAPGSNLNIGNPFDGTAHAVGWPTPQPFDLNGNLLVATWIVTNVGAPIPPGTILTVTGRPLYYEPPCWGSPLVNDAEFELICQEGGEMIINGGPSCTVAVEERTWTEVRSLYR